VSAIITHGTLASTPSEFTLPSAARPKIGPSVKDGEAWVVYQWGDGSGDAIYVV
jgi:hypothetical protein